MGISVGDTVVLKGSVIKRSRHGEHSRNFIGNVVGIFGNTCDVETVDGIRAIPVANLARKANIYNWRTEKSSEIIMDVN